MPRPPKDHFCLFIRLYLPLHANVNFVASDGRKSHRVCTPTLSPDTQVVTSGSILDHFCFFFIGLVYCAQRQALAS